MAGDGGPSSRSQKRKSAAPTKRVRGSQAFSLGHDDRGTAGGARSGSFGRGGWSAGRQR